VALNTEQALLLKKGIIQIYGEVDEAMAGYIRECLPILAINDNPSINIWFTSQGGSVIHGLDIYDMLHSYPGQTTGLVINHAQSMAVIILQACAKRLANPNSQLLVHDPILMGLSVKTLRNQGKLQKALDKDSRRIYDRIYRILSRRSGNSMTTIRKLCNKAEDMFADEALAIGLIDEIV